MAKSNGDGPRPRTRRRRQHRHLQQQHLHLSHGTSIPAVVECDDCGGQTASEPLERMLDQALETGRIVFDAVSGLVFVPDVVAIEAVTQRPALTESLRQAYRADRFDGRAVYVWRAPDSTTSN